MKRRNFLKGIALIPFAVKGVLDHFSYPILHDDGVNDDTEALQAFFDGTPYLYKGELITNNDVLINGTYRVEGTVFAGRYPNKVFNNNHLYYNPKQEPWKYAFDLS